MHRRLASTWIVLFCLAFSYAVGAAARASDATTPGLRLIRFNGSLGGASGKPQAGVVGLTLSLYSLPDGGSPLWVESQQVQLDESGHYTVILGVNSGLPLDLFTSGKALWLGVQPQISGAAEQPRILLVAVPYALKAADADTLGGKPASDFVTVEDLSLPALAATEVAGTSSGTIAASQSSSSSPSFGRSHFRGRVTADGNAVAGQVAIYSGPRALTEDATFVDVKGKVGIGTTTPAFGLDLLNGTNAGLQVKSSSRSTSAVLRMTTGNSPGSGTSNADVQFYDGTSQSFRLLAALGNTPATRYGGFIAYKDRDGNKLPLAFLTSDVNNIPQTAIWITGGQAAGKSGNVGIGTTAPAAKLEVNGTSRFDNSVTVTGLTAGHCVQAGVGGLLTTTALPCGSGGGGGGTVTGVTAGTDLTGGGTGGVVTLNVDTAKVPQLGTANTFEADQTINADLNVISGASSATALSVQATDLTSTNTAINGLANGQGGTGVIGEADNGSAAIGVWGISSTDTGGVAGEFSGNVNVVGNLSKSSGSFKIDDPVDPANKYLYHSFVESPDMLNIYNGNATLDQNGEAVIQLPGWFGALNKDFRYQLTCIGGFAPVYIAAEISNNQFKIAGGKPGLKISWMVTGVRQDAWANSHRIPVEEAKPANERGFYLHPELYGAPPQRQIQWAHHSAIMRKLAPGSRHSDVTRKRLGTNTRQWLADGAH